MAPLPVMVITGTSRGIGRGMAEHFSRKGWSVVGCSRGPGTLVDAILRGAGMTNAETRSGFQTVSLEQLALTRPPALVLGFFDTFQAGGDSWGIGGHRILRAAVRERAVASLPGSMLGCPDSSSAEAVERLSRTLED